MASRYRRGDAVTPASGERDLHPHEKQVVKQDCPCFAVNPGSKAFLTNESHSGDFRPTLFPAKKPRSNTMGAAFFAGDYFGTSTHGKTVAVGRAVSGFV